MDLYGLEGAQFHKVHLFIAKYENDSMFDDVGQVVEACVSVVVDTHPEVECIDIIVPINQEFHYLQQHMHLNAWPSTNRRQCFLDDGRLKKQLKM